MNDNEEDVYVCPSFSSYSTYRLAETANRVAQEKRSSAADEEEFEFVLTHDGEELLVDGQIQQVFPVFNRDLRQDGGDLPELTAEIPLSRLFIEEDRERDRPPSCSSSEADELENHVPAGSYCVWRPKAAEAPMPSQCRKSKSTGSATMRWKLRDLLRRCKSDGKDSFVFLTPKRVKEEKPQVRSGEGRGHSFSAFYVQNKAVKVEDRKKSYLPYRQELLAGFFANVNGLGKSFPHS
ncbi:Protein of unknown function (DUF1645 [Striga hermonthica]|uniref:Uncharacterized protein n=1 Tax=Striga hermonthica TaxID=68872 RepID=A0A9N7RK23_STRHE|nr:Protein of unknown function (DUF1645 [Striga hermonthica]